MATYEEAVSAKDKFKNEFWIKDPNIYNIIAIEEDLIYDLITETVIDEIYYIKVYLFDMANAEGLPKILDGVDIEYKSTISK